MPPKSQAQRIAQHAAMLGAMGSEPRLRIVRLLLQAHPVGLFPNEIAAELSIAASTLSHHLDKLKSVGLVEVRREGTFLRYTANSQALQQVLAFLYQECCTRNQAVEPRKITCC